MTNQNTLPVFADDDEEQHAPHITVASYYVAEDQSEFVHKDLVRASEPWALESHVRPVSTIEPFGDVESWCKYVEVYEQDGRPAHLTWSESGLFAVLDYHNSLTDPGRCEWLAQHRFTKSSQWLAWAGLADGKPRNQRQLIESLEDLGEDIKSPDSATLVGLLRTLRANVSANAETTLDPNGSVSVKFDQSRTVNQAGEVAIPNEITIGIPVLKGHTEIKDGKAQPVLYSLPVRIRVSVDDSAHLVFRLSMPTAERVLEAVYLDRVEAARALLGEDAMLLRGEA